MKLAVLADIHANYIALQTVIDHIERWQPDAVVVAGDIVNRGPRPMECLDLIQQKQQNEGWQTVRGNHEDYVISYDHPNLAQSDTEFEIFRCAYWTYQQLNGNVSTLIDMPFQVSLTAPDGSEARTVHASMQGNRNGIFPRNTADQLREKIQSPDQSVPALLCVGHTHLPFVRQIDHTLVVNVGAVGLPFDGNPRVAYGQLTWLYGQWTAKIIRLNYDRRQAEQDFFETGFMHGGGPLTHLILDELLTSESNLYQWTAMYQDDVLAGQISLEDSVACYLAAKHGG